jgi:hypothetical protein
MASIILAGTTTGTALSLTGDTSGELQIQTNNGSTTALTLTTGGAAVFTAGTVSAPAITTTGDTNTGIFFPAADTIAFTEGGVESMRIDSSGNVGIGTTSPNQRLESTGTIRVSRAGTPTTFMEFFGGSGSFDPYINVPSGFGIPFNIDGTEQMRIDSSGNVAIGQPTAACRLDVNRGSAGLLANFTDGVNTNFQIETASLLATIGPSAGSTGMAFKTGNTERMRITSGGNLLVGATSGAAKLRVSEAADLTEADPHFEITGSGYSSYHWLDATAYYIGQNSASRSLRIYSSAETAGVNLAAGGTSWGTFSDERLKYDIEPITEGLNKLSNLRSVSYRLKDVDTPDSQKKLGVIAQDLVGVIDEVVDITKRSGDETEYMSVRYTELIPVLVKAIQELKAELDSVKAELQTLKGN